MPFFNNKLNKSLKDKNSFYILYKLYSLLSLERKKQIIYSSILMILSAIVEVLSIYSLLPFISLLVDRELFWEKEFIQTIAVALNIKNPDLLFFIITILLIFFVIASSIIRLINLWINISITQKVTGELSYQSYLNSLNNSYINHLSQNSSVLVSALNKSIDGTSVSIDAVLQLMASTIITIFIFVSLIIINFKVSLFCIFIFGFSYFFINRFTKKILLNNSRFAVEKNPLRFKYLTEGLNSIREIILNNNQQYFANMFYSVDRQLRKRYVLNGFIIASPRYIFEGISIILILFIALFLLKEDNSIFNPLAYLATFALGAQKVLPSLQTIYRMISNVRSKRFEVIDIISIIKNNYSNLDSSREKLLIKKHIKLNNINFSFNKNNPDKNKIIKNVSLSLKPGDRLGIIGQTGSGKTTLADILMGLLIPDSGNLEVDNIDISNTYKKKKLQKWRNSIAHVPQDIFISDATFSENIAFGIPLKMINIEKVYESAEKAQILDIIQKNSLGINSNVGESGAKLSGGQIQRLGIARALYKDTQVIILDEATSALDNATEDNIMKVIESLDKDKIIIIIAHRLRTVKICSRVIEIKEGKIKRELTKLEIDNLGN